MRRLIVAAAAALLLAASSAAAVRANDPGRDRLWVSPAETAVITQCFTGNSAVIYGAWPDPLGTTIRGRMSFCQAEERQRYFGLEFFTSGATTAAGYFVQGISRGANNQFMDFSFTGFQFMPVTAVCVSPAPDERLACSQVSVDGTTGVVTLTPIHVTDPLVASPSGPMYFCGTGGGNIIHPNCGHCV